MLSIILFTHLLISTEIVSGILFFYGFNSATDWNTAFNNCDLCTKQLATWSSVAQYNKIKEVKQAMGGGNVWIGLTDRVQGGIWKFIDGDTGYCGNDCDTIPQWDNVINGGTYNEPDETGDYAFIANNYFVQDIEGTRQWEYICEFNCGGNLFYAGFQGVSVNFDQAEAACSAFNIKLATFGSSSEFNSIKTARNDAGMTKTWIGLTDKDSEGKWKFIDNDFGYCSSTAGGGQDCDRLPQWADNEPNDDGCDGQDYAVLNSDDQIWDVVVGDQYGYVCQFEGANGWVHTKRG